jgi:DinB superfamily
MTDAVTPSDHVAAIAASLDRLQAFAAACPDDVWRAAPLSNQGDGRTVGVIVDHVADSCDYIGAWLRAIVAGEDPPVSPELVDQFNAAHAADHAGVTQADAVAHLQRSGDAVIALVGSLTDSDLELADGRVGRFAQILARHPDGHRTEIEAALRS